MQKMDEIYVRFAVDNMAKKIEDLKVLQRKLDPWNQNPADTHVSVAEKHRIYFLLQDLTNDIEFAKQHSRPLTELKFKKRRFWR